MPNHYPDGHNLGPGFVYDTPEEKEIERLRKRIRELEAQLIRPEEGRSDSDRLYHVFHYYSRLKPGWTTYGEWLETLDADMALSSPTPQRSE